MSRHQEEEPAMEKLREDVQPPTPALERGQEARYVAPPSAAAFHRTALSAIERAMPIGLDVIARS